MTRVGAVSLVAHVGHGGEVHGSRWCLDSFLVPRFRVLPFSTRVSPSHLHHPRHDPRHPDSRLPASPLANRTARTPPGKCGGGVWWRGCGFGSRGRGGRWLGCCSQRGGGARRATRRRRALRACQDSSTTRAASRQPACRRGSVDGVTSLACAWVSMAWAVHAWVGACRVSSGPSLRLDSASSAVCRSRLHPCTAPDSHPPGTSWLFSPAVAHWAVLPACRVLPGTRDGGTPIGLDLLRYWSNGLTSDQMV